MKAAVLSETCQYSCALRQEYFKWSSCLWCIENQKTYFNSYQSDKSQINVFSQEESPRFSFCSEVFIVTLTWCFFFFKKKTPKTCPIAFLVALNNWTISSPRVRNVLLSGMLVLFLFWPFATCCVASSLPPQVSILCRTHGCVRSGRTGMFGMGSQMGLKKLHDDEHLDSDAR